jgi:uncharacterized protein
MKALGKIINDPVYGFLRIPKGLIFDLIEHPWFQRLRRIRQVGLASLVYPGAIHTRFHHALGALHLTTRALEVLKAKGIYISEEETTAVQIAILLHDIGHGPFSHGLENSLLDIHHEALSLLFMEMLNKEFDGKLTMAIDIFSGRYPRRFLNQLVTGQLDMDRMDYLSRDSFFTGVSEGVIGYDRIIEMLFVVKDELVVEEKALFSVEKFLVARRLMYWQVYLHKTVLSSEIMMIQAIRRAKELIGRGELVETGGGLQIFFSTNFERSNADEKLLNHFSQLDDHDVMMFLKNGQFHADSILSSLCHGLINREIFKLEYMEESQIADLFPVLENAVLDDFKIKRAEIGYFLQKGTVLNQAYNREKDEIKILKKDGSVQSLSENEDPYIQSGAITRNYIWYPKKYDKILQ